MFRCLSNEQILFQAGLGDEALVELAAAPARLVLRLYEHDSVTRRVDGSQSADSLPDVHAAAADIASNSGLSIKRIHHSLVTKWLPSTHDVNADADTVGHPTHLHS